MKLSDLSRATEDRLGKVEKATEQEAIDGVAGKYPDAAGTHAAIRELAAGTVSQSSGVPTGAIIERGSNANGEYVKFADGTLLCWHLTALSSDSVTAGDFQPSLASEPLRWHIPSTYVSGEQFASAYAGTSSDSTAGAAIAVGTRGDTGAASWRMQHLINLGPGWSRFLTFSFKGRWY